MPLLPLVLAIVLVLAGCGGDDDSSTPDPATEAAAQGTGAPPNGEGDEPATPPPPTIGEIVWASEIEPESNRPVTRVDRFTSDVTTIYALLPVSGLPIGTVISASWTYNDTSLDTLAASTTVDVASTEMTWIEFHLSREGDEPWPDGTYAISITVNDAQHREASIDVVDAG